MDDLANNPALQKRKLMAALQDARAGSQMTQAQAARELGWSTSKLLRIENGKHRVSPADLSALLRVYGLTDPQIIKDIEAAAQAARTIRAGFRGRGITAEYRDYLSFEQSAATIRQCETLLIPGHLQTEPYALATIRGLSARNDSEEAIHQRVGIRLSGQQIHQRQPPPIMHFLLDEAVIHRRVGGRAVMIEQLRHLKELNRLPHLTIQIIPFEVGIHLGMCGPFILLSFAKESDRPVVYRENDASDQLFRDDVDRIDEFSQTFEELAALAAPVTWFDRIIDDAISAMNLIGYERKGNGPTAIR